MDITINVDPKGNGQIIWSRDLNTYLQIYIVPESTIDVQIAQAKDQIIAGQNALDALESIANNKGAVTQIDTVNQ